MGVGVLLDLLPQNPDRNLSLGLRGYGSYLRADYALRIENRSSQDFPAGTYTEEFRRYDWVWSLGYSLEWQSFWNRHWGYHIGFEFGQGTFEPYKMKRLQYAYNGQDLMDGLPQSEKEFRFVESPAENQPETEATQLPKDRIRWNTFAPYFGVSYRL